VKCLATWRRWQDRYKLRRSDVRKPNGLRPNRGKKPRELKPLREKRPRELKPLDGKKYLWPGSR